MTHTPAADLIEPTPPPAFPEWLKRMFPTLRAEETNMLFQAFRERRLRARGGWFKRRIPSASMRVVVGLVIAVGAVAVGGWAFSTMLPIELGILFGGVLMVGGILESLRRKKGEHATMPNSVHEVFGFRNFANPAAIDLYLTSTTSGDIVEAIYLERYEVEWRGQIVGVVVVMVVVCFYAMVSGESVAVAWHIFELLCTTIAGFYACRFALLIGHEGVLTKEIRPRLLEWKNPKSFQERVLRVTTSRPMGNRWTPGFTAVVVIFFVFASAVLLSALGSELIGDWLEGMGGAWGWLQGLQRQGTHLSLGLLAVAGVCNLLTESWRLYVQHDLARLGKEATEPYRLMIERIVEGNRE